MKPITKSIVKNEGSHTRLISYLHNIDTLIKISQIQKRTKREIRYVWLETSLYTNITFARSLWIIYTNQVLIKKSDKTIAIGQLFIKNKSDIHKNLIELYLCYCKDIEKKLKFSGIIWGRKYILDQKYSSSIVIQEFFSPNLMLFSTTRK